MNLANQTGTTTLDQSAKAESRSIQFRTCLVKNRTGRDLKNAFIYHSYLGEGGGEDSVDAIPFRAHEETTLIIRVRETPAGQDEWFMRWEDYAGARWETEKTRCDVLEEDAEASEIAATVLLLEGNQGVKVEKPASGTCQIPVSRAD